MNATLTIDKAGRVVIPKPLRDELNLVAGDTLALESEGDQVTLRPVRPASRLIQERGVWVFPKTGKKMTTESTNKVLRDIYAERERSFFSGDLE